jgi:hypothetical protein
MATRSKKATQAADTDPHGAGKPDIPAEGDTTVPVGPFPGSFGHPDAVYCPECGRTAIGRMIHGPHEAKK